MIIISADPLSNVSLSFDTKEDAIAFATEYGILLPTLLFLHYIYHYRLEVFSYWSTETHNEI